MVENKQETSSDSSLLHEVMQKKEKIKALEAEIAKRDADNEKKRTKKMEEDGKLKELISEQTATIDELNSKIESQTGIVANYKQNLVDSITSDKERKEHLLSKSVEFLEELNKEKLSIQPNSVANPKESLGAVRKAQTEKDFTKMSVEDRKKNWSSILQQYQK
tara:strand:- start:1510 stop:1998 length:489 start_codon:yes stop_codon:yes gene_type:complete